MSSTGSAWASRDVTIYVYIYIYIKAACTQGQCGVSGWWARGHRVGIWNTWGWYHFLITPLCINMITMHSRQDTSKLDISIWHPTTWNVRRNSQRPNGWWIWFDLICYPPTWQTSATTGMVARVPSYFCFFALVLRDWWSSSGAESWSGSAMLMWWLRLITWSTNNETKQASPNKT